MSLYSTRLVLVIAAEQQDAANAACAALGFGPRTFLAPVWTGGSLDGAKATHYWCSWAMKPESESLVLGALAAAGVVAESLRLDRSDPAMARPSKDEVLQAEGLKDWRTATTSRDNALGAGQENKRTGGN